MATASSQALFAAALLDPDLAVPPGLRAPPGADLGRRFAVYRNNVVVSLVEALAARFPVVHRLVGEAFFAAMAGVFVRAHPPGSRVLASYGDELAGFIEGFEPAQGLPYLPDVARLEAMITRAQHARDGLPLDPGVLQRLAGEQVAEAVLELHPSAEVLASPFAIVSLWQAHQAGPPGALAIGEPEEALVARPHLSVDVYRLPPGGARFVEAIQRGASVAEAAEDTIGQAPGADLAEILATMVRARLIVAVRQGGAHHARRHIG